MNITINGKTYVTKRDRFGWTLNSPFDGVSKTTNEPVIGNKTTYHATFGQTLTMIADRELGGCEDLQEVREMVQKLREELLGANDQAQTPRERNANDQKPTVTDAH